MKEALLKRKTIIGFIFNLFFIITLCSKSFMEKNILTNKISYVCPIGSHVYNYYPSIWFLMVFILIANVFCLFSFLFSLLSTEKIRKKLKRFSILFNANLDGEELYEVGLIYTISCFACFIASHCRYFAGDVHTYTLTSLSLMMVINYVLAAIFSFMIYMSRSKKKRINHRDINKYLNE